MQTNPIDPFQNSSSYTGLNPTFSRQVEANALSTVLPPAVATGATATLPSPLRKRARSEFVLQFIEDFDLNSGDTMQTPIGSFEEIVSEEDLFFTSMDIEKIEFKLEGSGMRSEDDMGQDRVAERSAEDQELMTSNAGNGGSAATSMAKKHRHSDSLESCSVSSRADRKGQVVYGEISEAKKPMTAEQLAKLAATDPKKAKRILANRLSAANSKEKKAQYIFDLERRVQTLQAEATTLSAQLNLFQRDTTSLTAEHTELTLRVKCMEQHAHLHDALNEALEKEVVGLRIATGETSSSTGEANEVGLNPLPFNPSFLPIPRPRPTFPLQSIQLPPPSFLPPRPTTSIHPFLYYSRPCPSPSPHPLLRRLHPLVITKAPLNVKSENSNASAGDSRSNF